MRGDGMENVGDFEDFWKEKKLLKFNFYSFKNFKKS